MPCAAFEGHARLDDVSINEMDNLFAQTLLDWYAENKRDLPWRHTTDPYLIWISEIILQQTRVAQGYDYFVRFVRRFPDVQSLASASEEEVLKYWQGLGYYSRARNLHEAARSMAGGKFPDTYAGVRALKGVGDYTAAAICSLAYRLPYAVVDGNVYRVLARYFGIDVPIDSSKGKKLFAGLAQEMLDKAHPAEYNQAIMDFGALQCTPQTPGCLLCPLAAGCMALAGGNVANLPVKQHKTQTTDRYFNYLLVRMGEYVLLHKRTADDIWKNLFEPPLIEADHDLTESELLGSDAFRSLLAEGDEPAVRTLQRNVKHVLSHRVIYANFYEVILPAHSRSFASYIKVRKEDLDNYAVSRLVHASFEKFL